MKATDMNCVITHPTGSYAHKGLYPTLRFVTTLIILTLTATMAWAANSDATTLSTGIDDAPPSYEEATDWTTLKSLVEAGGTVKLTNNVTRNANNYDDYYIEVTKAVTLDLNGCTLDGGGSTYGYTSLFYVTDGGNLTITDNSSGKGGTITNVWGAEAIYVEGNESNYGEATFEAGAITSCTRGVIISGYGKFTMTGGTITGNTTTGVDVINNATFTMTGGTITGNGIGVKNDYSTTFTVSGNVNITGNTEWDVRLDYELNYDWNFNPIHIDGELAGTARIGVWTNQNADKIKGKTFTDGLNGNGSKANFVSNNNELEVVTTARGELAFEPRTFITAHEATFNGVTKYWATFYHPDNSYRLPEGSQAFYVKGYDNALYLLGEGDEIPNDYAVIIMSDTDRIGLAKLGQEDESHVVFLDDNKLIGTDGPTNVSDVVYVLSEVDGELGFYKFSGVIPAHKAYLENNEE